MITVAMLSALGRQNELAVHVRGALNNGVSARELQEILLQCAIYAGAPAALEAFRTAGAVLKEAGVTLEQAILRNAPAGPAARSGPIRSSSKSVRLAL